MRVFHEYQQNAYDKSSRLILVLAGAIFGTVVLSAAVFTYLVAVWDYINGLPPEQQVTSLAVTFSVSAVACALIIATGTVIKLAELRAGGKVIAEDLGGRLIEQPKHPSECCLTNIVEEISIASGIPVPPIYVLEGDNGINAFAAGYDPQHVVIAVTRGALRYLSRDQLQGVIAHEFSHILNGDTRLNLRMVGWLHGVLAVAIVAEGLIEAGNRFVQNSADPHSKVFPIHGYVLILVGCMLWPAGLIGTFMSLLAKSATSRQREFLADAFAVQFTRHPEGLAGALKRVAGHTAGGRVRSSQALEASHMFFVEGCGRLASLLASHPSLTKRILRLDPEWDGVPLFGDDGDLTKYAGAFAGAMGLVAYVRRGEENSAERADWLEDRIREVPDMLATVEFAESVLKSLPDPVMQMTETPGGTSLVLYALWLANSGDELVGRELLSESQLQRVESLVRFFRGMEPPQQLLLFDTAIEELRTARPSELEELKQVCQRFVAAREDDNLFQWMWTTVVGASVGLAKKHKPRYRKLKQVEGACEVVLSRVCHASGHASMAGFSFQRGLANLGLENSHLLAPDLCSWQKFLRALDLVAQLAPKPRRQFLLACSAAASADRGVAPDEAYILRGICKHLGYDVPSVLPGQPVAPGT